jgi:hypothetical protein
LDTGPSQVTVRTIHPAACENSIQFTKQEILTKFLQLKK